MRIKTLGRTLETQRALRGHQETLYSYEVLFTRVFGSHSPLLFGTGAVLGVWGAISWAMDYWLNCSTVFVDWWIYYAVFCVIIIGAVTFLNLAKGRLKKTRRFLMGLVTGKEAQEQMKARIDLIGDHRGQVILSSCLGLVSVVLAALQTFIEMPVYLRIFIAIAGFIALYFTGHGLWVAFASLRLVESTCDQLAFNLDFVNPAKTLGIRKFAGLMAFYASLFTLQVLLWEIPYLVAVITAPLRSLPMDINDVSFLIVTSVFVSFLPFVLFYFIRPQLWISSAIEDQKSVNLQDIQSRIRYILCNSQLSEAERVSVIKSYLEVHKEFAGYKGTLPIRDFLGFAVSFAATATLSIASNIQAILKIGGGP